MFKIIKSILLLAFLVALSSYAVFSYHVSKPIDKDGKDIAFVVEKGDGVKKIGSDLKKAGLIRSQFFFETYVWLEGKQSSFQAGEYVLNPKLSMREIVRAMIKGETLSKERSIKVIEGWSTKEIAGYLESEQIGKKEDFYRLAGYPVAGYRLLSSKTPDYTADFAFLADKPKAEGLEGYLFPDTYRIFKDAKQEDVIRKMLANFDRKLTKEMRDEIIRQKKTIFQIVTLASVIEKESGREVSTAEQRKALDDERKMVAGIFYNRLAEGMPLGSDATINYITGKSAPQAELKDLAIDSPYNTYKYGGLPPGPIANPSLSSIMAAVYPAKSDFYYFLHKQPNGEAVYSRTYPEHLDNKAKYLK